MPSAGTSVGPSRRAGRSRRSSRYIVMSREPCGTGLPSTAVIRAAMRPASGTPRVGMPRSTTCSAPWVRSMISWAILVSARLMSAASRTVLGCACGPGAGAPPAWLGTVTLSPGVPGFPPAGCAACATRTSFPASRDGPLKDASSDTPYQPGGPRPGIAAPRDAACPGTAGRTGPGPGLPYVTYLTVTRRERPPWRRLGVSAGPTGQNPCARKGSRPLIGAPEASREVRARRVSSPTFCHSA